MKYLTNNYHTHTVRCHHAKGTDREYIEAAIRNGIRVLGFSDHTPMPFKNGFQSNHRISLDQADDYFTSLAALREEYKDKIEIHIGVETEFYPESFGEYMDYMSQFPVEYMVLGQHFLWREEDKRDVFNKLDDPALLEAYYDNVIQAINTGKFLYLAHPDVFHFTGKQEDYIPLTRDFLQVMKEKDVIMGINRYGMAEGRNYPNPLFWKLAGEAGCKGIIELDAHSPDVFDDEDSVAMCQELADHCGVQLVTTLDITNPLFP